MSSKEEAKSEAYRRLYETAKGALNDMRVLREGLEKRVDALEVKARASEAERAAELARAVEGVKADLLAATRRVVVTEAGLDEANMRSEVLHGALLMIAAWPTAHSSEARAMKEAARQALRDVDNMRRFPPAEDRR